MAAPKHEQIAKTMIDTLFHDMQNPQFQGPAFTWEKFPKLAKSRVETELFLYYSEVPAEYPDIQKKAGEYAVKYANELLEKQRDSLTATEDQTQKRGPKYS